MKQWLVLAPIPIEASNGALALDQEQIIGEHQLRPRAGEKTPFGVWSKVPLNDYLIDFNEHLGEYTPWSLAFAVCYIESQKEQSGLKLRVSSDDESKIYLNHKEVYRSVFHRPYFPDIDVTEGIKLEAGINTLVFKVANGNGDWLGSVRLTDRHGNPVKGIKVTLDPGSADASSPATSQTRDRF